MSFYIRFVLTDQRPVSVDELETALREVSPSYAAEGDVITFAKSDIGLLDITLRGDPVCDDDLDLLAREAERKRNREPILAAVRNAKSLVCVQVLNTHDPGIDEILAPLWNWLLSNRAGLLAREGGYFFDHRGELK